MTAIGFSWPSITFCCKAPNTSLQAIGVGFSPAVLNASMWVLFSIVRIFMPFASAGVFTATLEFVRLRKPFSQKANPFRPDLSKSASSC